MHPSRSLGSVLAALALSAAVAGCSDDGSTSAPSPDSFDLERHEGDGFSMDVPSDWTLVSGSDFVSGPLGEDLEASLAEDLGPGLAAQMSALFESGALRLFVFDVAGSSAGFVDNLNVVVLPRSRLTAEGLLSVTEQQLEEYLNATVLSSEIRSYPAGETVIFRYDQAPQGQQVEGIGATIITDSQEWTLTMTATDLDRVEELFYLLVESFREAG